MEIIDSDDFANALCEADTYRYMEIELSKDNRKNNNTGDLQERYNNYRTWSNSKMKKDIDKAVALIPENGTEISVRDLRRGLSNYGLSDDYASKVVRSVGENDKRIKDDVTHTPRK